MTQIPPLLADAVQHRITSRLVDGFDSWWQAPAAILAAAVVAGFVIWMVRRDAAELGVPLRILLATLRLTALAAVAVAWLDVARIAEHEIVLPSRVAVLIDSSASMSLPDDPARGDISRGRRATDLLEGGGLLAALAPRHEVSLWRFDADAEPLIVLPVAGQEASDADWRAAVAANGYESRLGEALASVLDREPAGVLAGIVVLSDGANNAGLDPLAAAARLAKAGVAVTPLGIGSESLPANVRVADLIAPARVFPGDAFAVTAYLQAQGLEGQTVAVDLLERPAGDPATDVASTGSETANAPSGQRLDTVEVTLPADGELLAVRFDLPGLPTPGSRMLTVRIAPPAADRAAADDSQTSGIEVVDRVTRVLLMAGGPGREYRFMRNVLHRDASFETDVLLGTAAPGMSQDARRILDAFPPSDEALAAYDAVVAIDCDWERLEPIGWSRLERWVARESGGLLLVAGGINMAGWLEDPRATPLRGLFPVEFQRPGQFLPGSSIGEEDPMPLEFTRDGVDAEFLWLAAGKEASRTVWAEFPGVYSCFPADEAKPGATVYARVARPAATAGEPRRIYLAGQLYGGGTVLYAGSGELWRLRGIGDASYERLVPQIVRHVSQGRLLRGERRARLLVDRDRHPVGGTVQVRLALADEGLFAAAAARPPACRAIGPDGVVVPVPLVPEPSRPGTLQGGFVAGREGAWRIEAEPVGGAGEGPLVRRIQVQLPDRELARPKLNRPLLESLASLTGGAARFPPSGGWSATDAAELAAAFPDRSRREYETGADDDAFKRRLNATLLAVGCGCLCLEWITRRLAKLA